MARMQTFIEKVRSFNRFYTNVLGLLDQHFLDTPFSLIEGRVLYEIRHMKECSARKIRENLAIDEGYLSRIINKFAGQGLIRKSPSSLDKRLYIILLTEKGKKEFAKLNENSNNSISRMIEKLSAQEKAELVERMEQIQALLTKAQIS